MDFGANVPSVPSPF